MSQQQQQVTPAAGETAGHKQPLYGLLAEIENPKQLMDAARKVNQAGYTHFDTYSPFPIHGMDEAMGLKPSKLGWIVFGHGLLGFAGGLALQIWTHSVAYPINISGKPFVNIPSFVPITFELTILIAGLGAFFGLFYLNDMPRHHNPLFNSENIARATDDGFFICIEARDELFSEEKTKKLLEDAGATNIEKVYK